MVTITYNPNGGEGEMKPQAVESGFEVKLNANTFTKDGSDFTGWNEAADGSGKAYADGATVKPTGDLTLYAQWQAKSTPEDPGTENPDPEQPGTENPDPEQPGGGESDVDLQLTKGTAVFNKTDGLTLSFSGSTLPENASASVSLNGTQVDSQFNSEGNAVIVDLEALTNDTVGMTVTVTVSAEGYNDAVLTYEGVNTVWIPDGVTATFDATEKIGSESVSVTISQTEGSDDLSGIKISSGTYSVVGESAAEPQAINVDGLSFTAPILEGAAAKDAGTEVTISLVLAKANAEPVPVSSTLKVYPSTHVRYDGRIFQQVKGFDFSTENTVKTAGVTVKRGAGGDWTEKSNWDTVTYSDGEGYTFTTNNGDGVRFVFPETDDDLDFELIMVETKWNNSNANIHLSWWYSDADIYGYSFYKGGKSFFILDSYNFDAAYGFDADVTENTFNRFYAFDDGVKHSGRVNDGDVKSFSFSDSHTLDSFASIQLEFNEGASCTYTLRTVNFYKPLSN